MVFPGGVAHRGGQPRRALRFVVAAILRDADLPRRHRLFATGIPHGNWTEKMHIHRPPYMPARAHAGMAQANPALTPALTPVEYEQ
jgi:hypothetical protein